MFKNPIPQIHIPNNNLSLFSSRSTSPTVDYDSPRTPPKPEVIRKNPKSSIKDDSVNDDECIYLNTESLPQSHSPSNGNSRKHNNCDSKSHKNSKKYSSSYGRKTINDIEIPNIQVGFIFKQCQLFSSRSTNRYFVLNKGILSNFKTKMDSNDENIKQSRSHKQINLKDYRLACDATGQKLTLLALDRSNDDNNNNNNRQKLTLCFFNKGNYQAWEQSIKEHSTYANLPKPTSTRFEELKLISTMLLNCDIESFMDSEKRDSAIGSVSGRSSSRLSNSRGSVDGIRSSCSNVITTNENEISLLKKIEPFVKSCKSTGRSSFMSIENVIEEERENEEES